MKRRRGNAGPLAKRTHRVAPFVERCEDRVLMAVFRVTVTNDAGPGSLREAINSANVSTDATNSIVFTDLNSSQTIFPLSPLPTISPTNSLTINGTTQDNKRAEINGSSTSLVTGDALTVTGRNVTVRNLVIDQFKGSGITLIGNGSDSVLGCYIGTDPLGTTLRGNTGRGILVSSANNIIGGGGLANQNVISGNSQNQIELASTAINTKILNNFIGLNSLGTAAVPPTSTPLPNGIEVMSGSNSIGIDPSTGLILGNAIAGNNTGIDIAVATATNNAIAGNSIGTNANGTAAIPNTQYGIYVAGPTGTTIGGTAASASNLISGNTLAGIFVQGLTTTATSILGNQIGLSSTGGSIPNGNTSNGFGGIRLLTTASPITISGNTIANNVGTTTAPSGAGVLVDGGTGASILTNSIYSNSGLGIALANGANNGITAPTLAVAEQSATISHIAGSFIGTPSTTYRLQFFKNLTPNPSGKDGQTFVDDLFVTTSAVPGPTTFDYVGAPFGAGYQITATLSQVFARTTSQFSNSKLVSVALFPDLSVTTSVSPATPGVSLPYTYTITVTNIGDGQATNVTLTDLFYGGVGLQSTNTVTRTSSLGNIGAGRSRTFSFTVTPTTTDVQLQNTASAFGSTFINGTAAQQFEPDFTNNTSTTLSNPVAPVSDLQVYVNPSATSFAVGDSFALAVTVVNAGPSIAAGGPVTITLPAFLGTGNYTVDSDQGTVTQSGNVVTVNTGTIPGQNFAVTITINGTASQVGTFPVTASIDTSGEADPNMGNNTATNNLVVLNKGNLGLTISGSPNPAMVGGTLTYGIVVTNNGPSDVLTPVLTDLVPAGLIYDPTNSASSQGSLSFDGTQVVGNLGPIRSGSSATIFLAFTPTASGLVSNTVTVANAANANTVATSNTATTTVAVSPSSLGVVIVPPTNPLTIGVQATYTVLVTNVGPATAPSVVLTDILGSLGRIDSVATSVGSASSAGNDATATIGLLGAGQTAIVTILVTPLVSGILTNQASVMTTGYDPNMADNSAASSNVISPADLAVATTAPSAPVLVNEQRATFTVVVANNGPASARNVVLTDVLPTNATLAGLVLSQGTASGSGTLLVNLGDLAPGALATVTITVIPTSVGTLVNNASVKSANYDPNAGNNASQSNVAVFNQPGTLLLPQVATSVLETAGSVTVTVNRLQGTLGAITVDYATSDLTAKAGVNYTATSGTLTFAPGQTSQTITIPILHDNIIGPDLAFAVALSNPGGGALLATTPTETITVVNTDRDLIPPTVTGVVPILSGQGITGFVVTFDEAMDPARAQLTSNYAISLSGRDPGANAGSGVAIRSATYDPSTHSVTLQVAGTLPSNRFYLVNLNGSTGTPLTDTSGNPLDGTGTGVAGRNYLTTIGEGTNLKYLDANGNIVTITLKQGGTMLITRNAAGNASSIALSNIVARRSVLSGSRVRTKASTSGRVDIGTITGLRKFGDVKSNLTTAPFYATFAPVVVNGSTLTSNVATSGVVAAVQVAKLSRAAIVSHAVPAGPKSS